MKDWAKILFSWWRTVVSDPRRRPRFAGELLAYFADRRAFRAQAPAGTKLELAPVLFQRGIPSAFDAHYVYQAAWAIKRIAASQPASHTDISSNIPYVA